MIYPSMRDENGVKPPHDSLAYWVRFLRVYGMGGSGALTVSPSTPAKAEAVEAVAAFQRKYPHLVALGHTDVDVFEVDPRTADPAE